MNRRIRYCIFENEFYTCQNMCNMIAALRPSYECIGKAEDLEEARCCYEKNPDIIISDIYLCDGNVLDLLKRIHCNIPVIFTTGYYQHDSETDPITKVAYLLKPVSKQNLLSAFQAFENINT